MTHPKAAGQTFNVGSGTDTSVREIFEILAKAIGVSVEAIYRDSTHFWDAYPNLFKGTYPLKTGVLEKEVRKYTLADTAKSRELLGWNAQVSIEDGLTRTARYAMRTSGLGARNP
jgi:nucleoside-diphosphate-sugar epimerase